MISCASYGLSTLSWHWHYKSRAMKWTRNNFFIPYLLGLFRTFLHIFVLLHLFINDGNDIMLRLCLYSTLKKIDLNHPTFPTIFSGRLTLIIRQFLPHFHVNHKPQFANFCLTENMHMNDWLFRCLTVHNYTINAHDLLKLYNTILKPSSTCTK